MIKLIKILNEITVNKPAEPEYRKRIRDYINNISKGDLDLSGLNEKIKLPNNFKVGGNLDLASTLITSLPDDLEVGGSLNLNNTPITSLPDNFKVGGNLYLSNTKITSLPDNLEVGGYLNLYNTQLSQKYTEEDIKKMVPGVKGKVYI